MNSSRNLSISWIFFKPLTKEGMLHRVKVCRLQLLKIFDIWINFQFHFTRLHLQKRRNFQCLCANLIRQLLIAVDFLKILKIPNGNHFLGFVGFFCLFEMTSKSIGSVVYFIEDVCINKMLDKLGKNMDVRNSSKLLLYLYCCIIAPLEVKKRLEKKLRGNYKRILSAALNNFWK